MTKYNAIKTTIDGFKFDSIKESTYYLRYRNMLNNGKIQALTLQPEFMLHEAFTDSMGNKHRAIKYIADFKIIHNDLSAEIIDVKGMQTDVYKLKKKLFLKRYPEFKFTEV